jgi:hypothetical protein
MRRIVMIAGCIASCVLGATGAATASAAAPEFGKCVPAPSAHTGEYVGKSCLAPAGGKGGFNWEPAPGAAPKFALNLEGTVLKSAGREIKCESTEGEGEYTSAKTVAITKLILKNCKVVGVEPLFASFCQNVGAFRGEITLSELVGELGYIQHTEKIKVGLDLKPKLGSSFGSFECGGASELTEHGMGTGTLLELEGSVIGRMKPINKGVTEQFVVFATSGGAQLPEQFEGGAKDTLTELVGVTKTPEPATLKALGELVNEEAIEVKGK